MTAARQGSWQVPPTEAAIPPVFRSSGGSQKRLLQQGLDLNAEVVCSPIGIGTEI